MEIQLRVQLMALLVALLMGLGIGLIYDLLRPMRYYFKKAGGILLDALFCMTAGAAIFIFAMGADSGRLGVWELSAALVGFIAYINFLSPPILRLFSRVWQSFVSIFGAIKNFLKKTAKWTKRVFQKAKECFIIKK